MKPLVFFISLLLPVLSGVSAADPRISTASSPEPVAQLGIVEKVELAPTTIPLDLHGDIPLAPLCRDSAGELPVGSGLSAAQIDPLVPAPDAGNPSAISNESSPKGGFSRVPEPAVALLGGLGLLILLCRRKQG